MLFFVILPFFLPFNVLSFIFATISLVLSQDNLDNDRKIILLVNQNNENGK